jgi:methylmalonyl-CoA mutase, N-terminal domain
VAKGEWIQVGVNGYTDGDDTAPSTLYIDPAVETQQLAALAAMKRSRDDGAVRGALARLKADAGDPSINLMPALIDAARAHVTVGESMGALETVFGTWYERSVV